MDRILRQIAQIPPSEPKPDEQERERFDWAQRARPEQLEPPGDWRTWFVLAGRGFGKTRTGAETVRSRVEAGRSGRISLIAPTAADARDVMVEGESGIMNISPPWFRPLYEPSKRRITWPNGAVATLFSADEPDRLRGPQSDFVWGDEPASWRYPEAWDMAMFGLRLGADPRAMLTGTPKPTRLVLEILKQAATHITRGRTLENAANLAPAFLEQIVAKYEGTRLGRQELDAEVLTDTPGALWTLALFDLEGFRLNTEPASLPRVVIGVDPNASNTENSDEMGIVAAGMDSAGDLVVLGDYSLRGSPQQRAAAVVMAYHRHKADAVILEVNNGGDWIPAVVQAVDSSVPCRMVHATRGKLTRAEPIALRYEQGRAHHVGVLPALEEELTTWTPGNASPNRMDALVWAAWDLLQPENEWRAA